MRRLVWTLALVASVLAPTACGSNSSAPGAAGGSTTIPPTLTGVAPGVAYRGRGATLQVGGAGTDFDDATVATIAGATVLSHRASAPGSLRLGVFIPADFAARSADIDVGGITLKSGLAIDDPVSIAGAIARAPAGYSLAVHLVNRDVEHPFADSTLHLDAGPGIELEVTSVTATSATVIANIAPTAAAGARDLTVTLDDATAGAADAGAGDGGSSSTTMRSVLKGAFLIDAMTPLPIAADAAIDVTVPGGAEGGFLKASGMGKKLLDLRVTLAIGADGAPVQPRLALLDPAVGLVQPLSALASDELLVLAANADDPLLFVGPADFGTAAKTRFTVVLHPLDAIAAAEAEPNPTLASASSLTLPAVASASLSDQTDLDVFTFRVAAGTLVLRTQSTALDATDTQLEVLDSTGAVIAANEDEDPVANDVSSFLRIPVVAGTYYARIRLGHSTSVFGPYTLLGEVR